MPFDAPVVAQISNELNRCLPVRIDQIYQSYSDEFLFCGFGSGENFKLLVSLNAQYGRFHLYQGVRHTPFPPSSFYLLLRKIFSGSKLISFEAVPFERITKLTFEVYEPVVGLGKKEIWLELTGKSSNAIITDAQGLIIDAWRKNTPKKTGEREINPGNTYELPATGGRWRPVSISLEQFQTIISQVPADISLEKFFLKHWYGLSPLSIRQIAGETGYFPNQLCQGIPVGDLPKLYSSFTNWAESVVSCNFSPACLYHKSGELLDCSAMAIQYPPENTLSKTVSELNPMINQLFHERHDQFRFQETKQNLFRKINSQLDKNLTKLSKQEAEATAAEQGDQYRVMGELLMAYGYQVLKGSSQAKLFNHYDPDGKELIITLNPALNPQANAQHYFKKYQKAKKGQLAIAEQIAKTKEVVDYLESIEVLIQNALNESDLRLVQEEIAQNEAYPKKHEKSAKKTTKKEAPAEPRQYKTPAGHTIFVGRNNLQNDRLTFKIADPTDWWFHTQKIPGSHVILRPQPGVAVDDETLNYACQLAVYFSKARQSSKVPVDYTQRKNVKKPPAAKPGFVIYDFFKTAIITPEQNLLAEVGVEEGLV